MDDEFLHQIRETPPNDFVAALKARLDHQSTRRFRPTRALVPKMFVALLFGAVALSAATLSMKGGIRAVYEELVASRATSVSEAARASKTETQAPLELLPGSGAIGDSDDAQRLPHRSVGNRASDSVEIPNEELPYGLVARIEGQQPAGWKGDPSVLTDVMRKYGVPGVSVAVIKDFNVHWSKSYGIADVATGQPVNEGTLFQAAGLSQIGTAIAVLKAAEDDRVSLDADINEMLTSWKVPQGELTKTTPVTLRALLSHTSGADDCLRFPGYDPAARRPTLVQIIEGTEPSNVGPVHFAHPPLSSSQYTGGGPVIVQLAMTDTFGLPFEAIVQRDLLGPLGMKDSTYEQPIPYALEQRTARGHDVRGNAMPAKWYVHPEQAAAGLWSTSRDLAQLVIEVQRSLDGSPGRVLSKAMGRELTTTVGVGPFALGFIPVDGGKGAHVRYVGRNRGFYAAIWGHRSGYGLTVMTNGDGGDKVADEIWARVAAVYDWDPLNDDPSTYDTLRCQPQLRTLRQ